MSALHWLDEARFTLDHVAFHITIVERFASSSNHFQLVKHRQMVERYEALISSLQPKRIVELGIFQGGSAALFALLAKPERLVAVDLKDDPTTCLEDFIDERGLQDRVHTHYGFDQSNGAGLRRLVASEFGGNQIDLVVDDASHLLGPTRASFNALFPHVRPSGVFVIEDWSGQHQIDAALRAHMAADPSIHERLEEQLRSGQTASTPLSVLLFELILASAYAPRLFAEIVVTDGWAHVVRGPQDVDPDTFDVSRIYSDAAGALLTTTD